jgi:3-methyladenine DNA glycosylase AlkD
VKSGLVGAVREGLSRRANPEKAPGMQAYLKSEMPCLGVFTSEQRRVFSQVFAAYPLKSFDEWRAAALELWRGARFREERYAAIALTGDRRYASYQTAAVLPLYEEMVVTGAWWDYVDPVAVHRIGGLLRVEPKPLKRAMLSWSRSPDRWKRRSSIICQTRFKAETDLELLYACIEPNLGDRDFFLRKAIGWALREYSRADPAEVARYVREHESRLSPLSRREALKHVAPR